MFRPDSVSYTHLLAPGKRPMVLAQNGRHCFRVLAQTFELVDNQVSSIFLVSVLDFFLCQAAHAGNRTVDIVCMEMCIRDRPGAWRSWQLS